MVDDLFEEKVNSKQVFDGKLLKVFCDDIRLPNLKPATREYIKHNGAVCVVPVTEDGYILMVKQYRYPLERNTLEVPAGKLDVDVNGKIEDARTGALRELREETGAETERLVSLGSLSPSPAYTTEIIHIFLAFIDSLGDQSLDDDEFLNVEKFKLDELVKMVMNDEIQDAKTQIAVLKTYYYLQNQK